MRQATRSDVPGLVTNYEWLFAPPGIRPPAWEGHIAAKRLIETIEGTDSVLLVAEDSTGVLGFCSIYLDIESVRFGQRAWVEDLAVEPTYRSLGIGKRLLEAAKSWARSRNATHLKLDSGVSRVDAHRFYEREQPTGRSNCYAWKLEAIGS